MTMRMKMICLIFLVYIGIIFTYKTFVVPYEDSSIVSFDFSRTKNYYSCICFCCFYFTSKKNCCIARESASRALCLLRSAAIIL